MSEVDYVQTIANQAQLIGGLQMEVAMLRNHLAQFAALLPALAEAAAEDWDEEIPLDVQALLDQLAAAAVPPKEEAP